jgi:hypothetical protein
MSWRGYLSLSIIFIALLVGIGWLKLRPHRYHYKVTVAVQTPEGLKTGSAVREVVYEPNLITLPDMAAVTASYRGEAVAVDLPGGETLFALLRSDEFFTLQAAFGDDANSTLKTAKAKGTVAILQYPPRTPRERAGYPLLVTFGDVRDPNTLLLVDPSNFAKSFGLGVALSRITVQITDDPVTSGIEKRLSWLPTVYQKLDPDFQPKGVPVGNFKGLFSTEIAQ